MLCRTACWLSQMSSCLANILPIVAWKVASEIEEETRDTLSGQGRAVGLGAGT